MLADVNSACLIIAKTVVAESHGAAEAGATSDKALWTQKGSLAFALCGCDVVVLSQRVPNFVESALERGRDLLQRIFSFSVLLCRAQGLKPRLNPAVYCGAAHSEPVQLLSEDWASLMRQFKKKYGKQHPSKLPGQSYFDAFEEKLASGELKAETLAQVISETEEEQRKLKPEPSRHLGINLDASLMIQTRRRYLSAMPQNT